MANSWEEQLKGQLQQKYGAKKSLVLYKKYQHAFPHSYSDEYSTDIALADIDYLERLSATHPLEIHFDFVKHKPEAPLCLRLFQWQMSASLSDLLPMLENLNLRTENERPNKLTLDDGSNIWINDFAISYPNGLLNMDEVRDLFQDALVNIYFGLAENDGFNKLILGAALSWRKIVILRAYTKYLRQVGFRFTQPYIETALINNVAISKNLVDLFFALHDPSKKSKAKSEANNIEKQILKALEAVASLDEDRIIRRLLDLIKNTLRTNYFQKTADNQFKNYLSFKLNSRAIPEVPLPVPLYEIFVYAPHFEGIHLRNTKVARGGIRWSDRREDFRTEILGLMKAQTVKNAIIVPSGAKGGFVLKPPSTRNDGIACYTQFIQGLLDLTDNIIDKKIIHPKNVVCYDDDDPYLVVAADKGTATFSDLANSISAAYDFWLGDAFASGGRTGYDHKKMGITARGAWESIKRHCRELNLNPTKAIISTIGIGDMSGDVFGNGMLYSDRLKLIAAFDHRHIFIDPDPDPVRSYAERKRLFELATSSWEDYNPKLISKGGGVFNRNLKFIKLTAQMKKVLATDSAELPPNDLIRAILKAPVDLLYNGGIGTYVKSSKETNAEVGDRSNDYCRINGDELRCKMVGEGGNLGFTQLGRIEYAEKGGLINTDFIDNSAGVDCSDHEVNLKILLDAEMNAGKLSETKRNELLASVTKEVAELVLHDNYQQALVMSFSAYRSDKNMSLHINYIKELETQGLLDRQVEFIPDERTLLERKANEKGLTRPELAVLLAYTKINIKHEILQTDLPEDPLLRQLANTAFPASIRKKYQKAIQEHRLHRDIIATQLSNAVVNEMGITFGYRLQMETGATTGEIVRAHAVASRIFGTQELQTMIESLDFKIPLSEQYEMLYHIRNLIGLATRWFLHTSHLKGDLEKLISHFTIRVKTLEKLTPNLMSGFTKDYLASLTERFLAVGLPKEIATRIATYRAIYTSLNIIEVATANQFDLDKTAHVYFKAGERVNLLWFRDELANDSREGHWNTLARLTLRDELDIAQRSLTVAIMKEDKKEKEPNKLIEKWLKNNVRALDRWDRLLNLLHESPTIDYTMFFIAVRELIGLIITSQ